jgi:hypothetical protein
LEKPEIIEVNSLNGNDLIQLIVPILTIVSPLVAPVVQQLLADNRVTLTVDGIKISGPYKKVMKLLNEIHEKRNEEGIELNDD